MKTISISQARRLTLASQRLMGPELDPHKIIEHLGHVQIDTISVVERAHHHVFWARNQKYKPSDLGQLVSDRKVFEYWSHAASFLPMSEYRYTLPMKKAFKKRKSSWFPRDPRLMSSVLNRIKKEGPLRSKDFENTRRGTTGWWDWKPSKKALERLFLEGELEITRRDGFQKVYDVPERVIPASVDTSMPAEKEYLRFLIRRALRHHGLAKVGEIGYLRSGELKVKLAKEVKSMLSCGELHEVKVEGLADPYLVLPGTLDEVPKATSKLFILSPFDNLVIQRQKLKDFFNFDYQIECYVPQAKRKFGYFCLPVFRGCHPVARMDCKADRHRGELIVQSISYEVGVDPELIRNPLTSRLKSFAKFNGCEKVRFAWP